MVYSHPELLLEKVPSVLPIEDQRILNIIMQYLKRVLLLKMTKTDHDLLLASRTYSKLGFDLYQYLLPIL